MGDEPTDDDIEAQLLQASRDDWDTLWAAVDAFEREQVHAHWAGGRGVDRDGRPVFQVPYVEYSDAVASMLRAVAQVGGLVPFAWPSWPGLDRYRGGAGLRDAPVADAVRLITAIVRADRFMEGSIEATIEDGTLTAALDRLRRWYEEH